MERMSKLMEALRKAEEARRIGSPLTPANVAGPRNEITQAPRADGVGGVSEVAGPGSAWVARPTTPGAPARSDGVARECRDPLGVRPTGNNGSFDAPALQPRAIMPTAAGMIAAEPQSWERTIQQLQDQLAACEQQAATQSGEQLSIKAQLAAYEQLATKLEQDRVALRQRLEQTIHAAASVEQTKASYLRQVNALRECQVLSHAAAMTEQELQANATMIASVGRSHEQVGQELARYQQRAAELQKRLEQLQFQLSQAFAFTATAPGAPARSDGLVREYRDPLGVRPAAPTERGSGAR